MYGIVILLDKYDVPQLNGLIENVTYCVDCMKRDPTNPDVSSSFNHKVQVVPYNPKRNTSNLFAEDSE